MPTIEISSIIINFKSIKLQKSVFLLSCVKQQYSWFWLKRSKAAFVVTPPILKAALPVGAHNKILSVSGLAPGKL